MKKKIVEKEIFKLSFFKDNAVGLVVGFIVGIAFRELLTLLIVAAMIFGIAFLLKKNKERGKE